MQPIDIPLGADLAGSDQMVPPLTMVRTPRAQIGERAAQMLRARLRGEAVDPACVDLGFELVGAAVPKALFGRNGDAVAGNGRLPSGACRSHP